LQLDALGFEITLHRGDEQAAVGGKPLRHHAHALLRGGGRDESDDGNENRDGAENHAR
jgi:hypothetical protein